MRFETRQRIQGTVDEVERALLDERYFEFLLKYHGVLLELAPIEVKTEGDLVKRKVRYRPKPVIESIGPKRVPPEWFAFIETSTYDKRRKELTFTNTPTSGTISKMLVNTGTMRFRDLGAGQTERSMDGEISLKLPFLMKPLALIGEKIIQGEGLKILDNEIPVLNRFISEVIRKG
ncbi:hypothetical protein HUA74_28960 [Myxococcus sp. CA051A]|uniref:Uncharacterized protein n=1 Tax=Myxococcus llanfairpwllgwyngyllgogerychwyrndrobwllllantysiliogogogochensis TaxID=2590453 RepID=A0A540WP62_9BACT|nr:MULTISPECIES: hypothetical protein [Myxococcus]NTX13170.1 hypothetical protein [Myxococcus sp. CA056]NTX36379.1 hypothetical protein [Myxococcus sp. CA033]NTX55841.1 hypothetical protein [Myxococcus sp. CA039A]NTX64687.1 hypothetical protein [Myxococcus sp. CA051A]NVJ25574.1 hypothetical protein [Myxococcus sp. AM011]